MILILRTSGPYIRLHIPGCADTVLVLQSIDFEIDRRDDVDRKVLTSVLPGGAWRDTLSARVAQPLTEASFHPGMTRSAVACLQCCNLWKLLNDGVV
jgi:hypothetical protein